jgi:hypothetical protein
MHRQVAKDRPWIIPLDPTGPTAMSSEDSPFQNFVEQYMKVGKMGSWMYTLTQSMYFAIMKIPSKILPPSHKDSQKILEIFTSPK